MVGCETKHLEFMLPCEARLASQWNGRLYDMLAVQRWCNDQGSYSFTFHPTFLAIQRVPAFCVS